MDIVIRMTLDDEFVDDDEVSETADTEIVEALTEYGTDVRIELDRS